MVSFLKRAISSFKSFSRTIASPTAPKRTSTVTATSLPSVPVTTVSKSPTPTTSTTSRPSFGSGGSFTGIVEVSGPGGLEEIQVFEQGLKTGGLIPKSKKPPTRIIERVRTVTQRVEVPRFFSPTQIPEVPATVPRRLRFGQARTIAKQFGIRTIGEIRLARAGRRVSPFGEFRGRERGFFF